MLKYGILGFRQFKPSFAHSDKDIKNYSKAVDNIFKEISDLGNNLPINGELHHIGFKDLLRTKISLYLNEKYHYTSINC